MRREPDFGAIHTWQALDMGGWPDHKIRLFFYDCFWRTKATAKDWGCKEIAEQRHMLALFGVREPTTKWVRKFYPLPDDCDPEQQELLELIDKHLDRLNEL
jgi:hypothetical protein